jgi:hypothetical protein
MGLAGSGATGQHDVARRAEVCTGVELRPSLIERQHALRRYCDGPGPSLEYIEQHMFAIATLSEEG